MSDATAYLLLAWGAAVECVFTYLILLIDRVKVFWWSWLVYFIALPAFVLLLYKIGEPYVIPKETSIPSEYIVGCLAHVALGVIAAVKYYRDPSSPAGKRHRPDS